MKFCPNCGAELADDAGFCGACGTKLTVEGTNEAAPEKKAGGIDKKFVGIICVAIAVVVAIVILITRLAGGGYKKAVKEYFAFFNNKQTDAMELEKLTTMKAEYDFEKVCLDVFAKAADDEEDALDLASMIAGVGDRTEFYEDLYDDFEDTYGKNWKITYEIKKEKEIKKSDLKDIQESINEDGEDTLDEFGDFDDFEDEIDDLIDMLEDEYDASMSKSDFKKIFKGMEDAAKAMSKAKVTEGYNLTVKCTIEGKEDKGKGECNFKALKIDGDWVLYNADSMIRFEN